MSEITCNFFFEGGLQFFESPLLKEHWPFFTQLQLRSRNILKVFQNFVVKIAALCILSEVPRSRMSEQAAITKLEEKKKEKSSRWWEEKHNTVVRKPFVC